MILNFSVGDLLSAALIVEAVLFWGSGYIVRLTQQRRNERPIHLMYAYTLRLGQRFVFLSTASLQKFPCIFPSAGPLHWVDVSCWGRFAGMGRVCFPLKKKQRMPAGLTVRLGLLRVSGCVPELQLSNNYYFEACKTATVNVQ